MGIVPATVKLLFVFGIAFSMLSLPRPLTSTLGPSLPSVRANPAPVEPWYPAGPSMNTLVYKIYTDKSAEFVDLQGGGVDIPDIPLTQSLIPLLSMNPNFYVTQPISITNYFELEFHLGTEFWGCSMSFGNSACGRDIRQAFAHALDKLEFTTLQSDIAGLSQPIDNPVPPGVDLVLPNPCSWDATHLQSGSNCVVGEGGTSGGVAYHLAPAATCGLATCSSTPTRPWTPGLGTPDFCAAADHLIAAGLASGKNGGPGTGTCVLTGISPAVGANTVNIFARSDDTARLQGGLSVAEFVCALFTGMFQVGCSPYLTVTQCPLSCFPGFTTSPTTLSQTWMVYTASFNSVTTFDTSLYFGYDSKFVSGIPSIQPPNGPCSPDAVPTTSASNYMYLCDPNYDTLIERAEFSPCISAPGDPANGRVTPTFANCPNDPTKLTAKSASYQAQDEFGKNAFTIPWWTSSNRFAYPSSWQRVVLDKGQGFIPPGNIPAEFNAWNPNPAQAGTVRQGYSQPPSSLNPFVASTGYDLGVRGNLWDTLNRPDPDLPQSIIDWMTVSTQRLSNNQLTYTPPVGTFQTYRYTFRGDIFWQTGQRLSAWDAAFSYIAFIVTGAGPGAGLAPSVLGVKVISPAQMDLNINAFGPFTQLFLSSLPIIPGRFWSQCTASNWDTAASNSNFATANTILTPCIGPNVTSSGVIIPSASAVDPAKITPTYDPLASGILVGAGPWVCKSTGGVVGTGCSSTGTQNVPPGGTLTFQRYGLGTIPGGSLNTYFRSSSNLALWIWSGNTGDINHDFLNFGLAALCFGTTPTSGPCNRWSMGIGNPTGSSGSPAPMGLTQIGVIQRFLGINWVSPYDWASSPPPGIAVLPPVLYEGAATMNPSSLVGCTNSFNNAGGYDC